jgi:hypothetical protein
MGRSSVNIDLVAEIALLIILSYRSSPWQRLTAQDHLSSDKRNIPQLLFHSCGL